MSWKSKKLMRPRGPRRSKARSRDAVERVLDVFILELVKELVEVNNAVAVRVEAAEGLLDLDGSEPLQAQPIHDADELHLVNAVVAISVG